MRELSNSAVGLAKPLPAISGAEPCTASKMEASCERNHQLQPFLGECKPPHLSNVTRWGETKTTDKTGAHVGQDVTVQVGHDHDSVSVWLGILHDLSGSGISIRIASSVAWSADPPSSMPCPAGPRRMQRLGSPWLQLGRRTRTCRLTFSCERGIFGLRLAAQHITMFVYSHDVRLVDGGDPVPAVF